MFNIKAQNKLNYDDDAASLYSKFSKIKIYSTKDNHKKVNDDRRKLHSSMWTKAENILLLKLSQSKIKNKWKKISKHIGTKTASQCIYRLKMLSQTKIDPDSPETSVILSAKVESIEKNNKENNEGLGKSILNTNSNKKNRHVGIKLSNVTKLFGVVRNKDVILGKSTNINTQDELKANKIEKVPTKSSDIEMKSENSPIKENSGPFNYYEIIRKNSPCDNSNSNKTPQKKQKNDSGDFIKEYNKTFNNFGGADNDSNYEVFEKENSELMLLDNNPYHKTINKDLHSTNLTKVSNTTTNNLNLEIMEKLNQWKETLIEIQTLINTDEFKSMTQIAKMTKYSLFLVEINIFAKNATCIEEAQLCMEIQSQILKSMIEQTQKQLITNDGEELLL